MSSPEIRSQIQVGNVIPISNYTNMKNWLPPSAVTASAQIYLKHDLTSAWLQDAEVKRTFVVCYILIFSWTGAIVWSSFVLHFLYYSKTSAVWNSNIWSSITSQTQSVCKIALSNQASCCSAVGCCRSVYSLVKSLFHRGFKTDFIKCSISKWATHHSRKVMATLATWAVSTKLNLTIVWNWSPWLTKC